MKRTAMLRLAFLLHTGFLVATLGWAQPDFGSLDPGFPKDPWTGLPGPHEVESLKDISPEDLAYLAEHDPLYLEALRDTWLVTFFGDRMETWQEMNRLLARRAFLPVPPPPEAAKAATLARALEQMRFVPAGEAGTGAADRVDTALVVELAGTLSRKDAEMLAREHPALLRRIHDAIGMVNGYNGPDMDMRKAMLARLLGHQWH